MIVIWSCGMIVCLIWSCRLIVCVIWSCRMIVCMIWSCGIVLTKKLIHVINTVRHGKLQRQMLYCNEVPCGFPCRNVWINLFVSTIPHDQTMQTIIPHDQMPTPVHKYPRKGWSLSFLTSKCHAVKVHFQRTTWENDERKKSFKYASAGVKTSDLSTDIPILWG